MSLQQPGKENTAILTYHSDGPISPQDLKSLIVSSLDSDKAFDIETIDLRTQTALADFMVVASGSSTRQVKATAEKLRDRLAAAGVRGVRVEGLAQGDWAVIDAGDVIVHLFRPEVRAFYNIEKMWRSPRIGLEVAGPQHLSA